MNDARRRRIALRKRIVEQQKRREEQFLKGEVGKCIHKISLYKKCRRCDKVLEAEYQKLLSHPKIMEGMLQRQLGLLNTVPAVVLIRSYANGMPFPVRINLSARKPTEQIMNMRKNGFWAVDHGYLSWFGPELIQEVTILNGE